MQIPVGYLLKQISDRLRASADLSLQSRNLTFSQLEVLRYISSRGEKVTQKSIQDYLAVSHPTVVGLVSRMEKKGYLISYADPTDRRNKIVELTETAVQLSIELQGETEAMEQQLLHGLTPEDRETLDRLLKLLYKNLE